MPLPSNLPILPLRDVVVFPGITAALFVGRQMSLSALNAALNSEDNLLALFTQLDLNTEEPGFADLCHIGVLAKVEQTVVLPDGIRKTLLTGLTRILSKTQLASRPFLQCQPEAAKEIEPPEVNPAYLEEVRQDFLRLIKYREKSDLIALAASFLRQNLFRGSKSQGDSPLLDLVRSDNPGIFADQIISVIHTSPDNQKACLLELNPVIRLKFAHKILVQQTHNAEFEREIKEKAQMAIKDEHRQIFLREQLKIILQELGESAPIAIHNPIFHGRGFRLNEQLAFVLMPYAERFRPMYTEIIKPVVEQCGITCIRADDLYSPKAIMEDIWKLINEAKVVIADVTGKNPNVFYEIGLAHAVGKEVIIMSQDLDDVPFDLRHLRCLIYKDSVAGFKKFERQLYETLSMLLGLATGKSVS